MIGIWEGWGLQSQGWPPYSLASVRLQVAFAALKIDGSVSTWGGHYLDLDLHGSSKPLGMELCSFRVSAIPLTFSLSKDTRIPDLCFRNFQALIFERFLVKTDSSAVGCTRTLDQLSFGMTPHVACTCLAFAALKADQSVVTWGHRNRGGDSTQAGSEPLGKVLN